MESTRSRSASNCTVPSLYPIVKSLSLSCWRRSYRVMRLEDLVLAKRSNGGEKEMYLVLLIITNISRHLSNSLSSSP